MHKVLSETVKVLYTVFVLGVFLDPAFADPNLGDSLLVHEDTIQKLQGVLTDASLVKNQYQANYLEKLFQARVTAHRLRLSQIFLELAKSPDFVKKFPEFAPMVKDTKKTVEVLLVHDAFKSEEVTKNAAKALALLQGYDFKNPNPNLSPELRSFVSQMGADAVHDINFMDYQAVAKTLKKVGQSAEWNKSHNSLTEVLDFYDTYKSRQNELAKSGRKLASPSDWMKKLSQEGHYTPKELEDLPLKMRFAKFLEESDPLKNRNKFALSTDYLTLEEREGKKASEIGFMDGAKKLMAKASRIQNAQLLRGMASSAARALPLKTLSAVGLLAASGTIGADTALDLALPFHLKVLETSNCDSVNCDHFMKECAKFLKLPASTTSKEVMSDSHFQLCAERFFHQDLAVQEELRADSNLDRILNQFSPAIRTLTCSANSAQVEVNRTGKENFFMNFIYDKDAKLQSIKREGHGSFEKDQILAKDWSHSQFQHCDKNMTCRQYPVKDFALKNLYFSLDSTPIEAFGWAQRSSDMVDFLGDRIFKCCQKNSCKSYFTERISKFQAAKAKASLVAR